MQTIALGLNVGGPNIWSKQVYTKSCLELSKVPLEAGLTPSSKEQVGKKQEKITQETIAGWS